MSVPGPGHRGSCCMESWSTPGSGVRSSRGSRAVRHHAWGAPDHGQSSDLPGAFTLANWAGCLAQFLDALENGTCSGIATQLLVLGAAVPATFLTLDRSATDESERPPKMGAALSPCWAAEAYAVGSPSVLPWVA